jgi:hypothetical protein
MNNATLITSLQVLSLIIMIGTAESLFSSIAATSAFIISFVIFARCSIFINKNERWLARLSHKEQS